MFLAAKIREDSLYESEEDNERKNYFLQQTAAVRWLPPTS
jgi:hypothetical protein